MHGTTTSRHAGPHSLGTHPQGSSALFTHTNTNRTSAAAAKSCTGSSAKPQTKRPERPRHTTHTYPPGPAHSNARAQAVCPLHECHGTQVLRLLHQRLIMRTRAQICAARGHIDARSSRCGSRRGYASLSRIASGRVVAREFLARARSAGVHASCGVLLLDDEGGEDVRVNHVDHRAQMWSRDARPLVCAGAERRCDVCGDTRLPWGRREDVPWRARE